MTGFGSVTPEVTAPAPTVAAPVVAAQVAAPVAPATVTAFEGSIDERLEALMANT
jgi:hypothetical protein